MTEKKLSGNTSFLNNVLVFDNYNQLVQNKITSELLKSSVNCCNTCEKKDIESNHLEDVKANILIAQCKGLLGIHFCENPNNIDVSPNDNIVIKTNNEFEFATVIETGEIVDYKIEKEEPNKNTLPTIERIATEKDIERNLTNTTDSIEAKNIFLELVKKLSLEMKFVDVHFQFDRKKIFFFYTADGRVDFRELAKKLASHFKTRIELRQIGVRDEAKKMGGIATCGREYCCSTFLHNFKRITTDIAIENNISTNISKYTGPCGKLKCCLSFELE